MTNDGVAHLVIRHHLLLIGLQHAALLLQAGHNALDGFVEISLLNGGAIHAGGQQRRFIHQVGQISAGKAAGGSSDLVEVNALRELHLLGIDLENGFAAGEVGAIHQHLTVETAGAQQRCIEGFGLVGGRQHDHRLVFGAEAIHLGEQLVERLLALVVAADHAHRAGTALADGIEFVDEDDAGRFFLGFFKQVADASGASTHEELNEFRARNDEEGHIGLTSHGLGEQGFAGAWRAHQQHALGDAGANGGIALWLFEEVDDLGEFGFGFIHASHIGEGDARLLIGHVDLGLALGEAQSALSAASSAHGAAGKELQQHNEDQRRSHPAQDRAEDAGLLRWCSSELNAVLFEPLGQLHVKDRRGGQQRGLTFFGVGELVADLLLGDEGALHLAVIDLVNE